MKNFIVESKNKKRKISIAFIIVCVYIILSYIGQASIMSPKIQQVFMWSMIGLTFLTLLIKKKLEFNKHWLWYIGLIVLCVFSSLYSYNQISTLNGVYSMLVTLIISISISSVTNTNMKIELIMKTFSWAGFILFILLLVSGNLFTAERLGEELYGNANAFATVVLIAQICSVYFVINGNKNDKFLYSAITLSQVLMLFLSGGRKYIFVAIVFLYVLLIQKRTKGRRLNIIKSTIIILAIMAIGYYFIMNIPVLYNEIGIRLEQTFMSNETSAITGDSVRKTMALFGMDSFLQHPILGWGHVSFKILFGNFFGRYVYSHNNYIELLVNLGLIGFFYYYSFYIYIIKKFIKFPYINMKNENLKHFFIAFFISLFFLEMGIVSYYSQTFIQVFIAIGAKFILIQKQNKLIVDRSKYDEQQK